MIFFFIYFPNTFLILYLEAFNFRIFRFFRFFFIQLFLKWFGVCLFVIDFKIPSHLFYAKFVGTDLSIALFKPFFFIFLWEKTTNKNEKLATKWLAGSQTGNECLSLASLDFFSHCLCKQFETGNGKHWKGKYVCWCVFCEWLWVCSSRWDWMGF